VRIRRTRTRIGLRSETSCAYSVGVTRQAGSGGDETARIKFMLKKRTGLLRFFAIIGQHVNGEEYVVNQRYYCLGLIVVLDRLNPDIITYHIQ